MVGIRVVWDDEAHTIIRQIYEGQWAWEDLFSIQPQVFKMSLGIVGQLDFIVDRRATIYTPPVAGYQSVMDRLLKGVQQRRGIVVICGNLFAFELLALYHQQEGRLPFRYRYAATLEAAREQIYAARDGRLVEFRLPPIPDDDLHPGQLLSLN